MPVTSEYVKTRYIREYTTTITYADTTSAEKFRLPTGSRIIAWVFNVVTAFSGGTTELDIGTATDQDYYVDAGDISAVGQIVPSTQVVIPGPELTTMTPIYMVVGAGNTVGSVEVTCLFSNDDNKRF